MKAVLFAALVASAAAASTTTTCVIPAPYVTLNGAACAGPAAGYNVFVDCLNVDGSVMSTHQLTTAADSLLKFNGPAAATGCRVSSNLANFGTNLGANTGPCPAVAANSPLANGNLKRLRVECATGFSGLTAASPAARGICIASDAGDNAFKAAVPTATVGTFIYASGLADTPNTCIQGCTLPASLCQGGRITDAFIAFPANTAINAPPAVTNCILAANNALQVYPTGIGFNDNAFYQLECSATGVLSATDAAGGAIGLPVFPLNGALSGPIINSRLAATGTANAGFNRAFPTSATTLSNAFTLNTLGQARATAATFSPSTFQAIDVTGCPAGANYNLCIQQAVNYWRCRGFVIDSSTFCIANGVTIACPMHNNGFRCDHDGSKKGLLGLLGLLGIIPLCCCCLLLCCFLFPCCIRRKKTEGDVHFATFDPHTAPLAASYAPAATAVCAPTAMCAEPFVGGTYGPGFGALATPVF